MPFNLKGPELLILILIIVLLFGAKRMPEAARSLGRSLRIFKAETKGLDRFGRADGPGHRQPRRRGVARHLRWWSRSSPACRPLRSSRAPQTPPGQPHQA